MSIDNNNNNNNNNNSSSSGDESSTNLSYKGFFKMFVNAKGTKEVLAVAFFMAFGIGCVIGVIPDTAADRYARIHHGYLGEHCGSLDIKPLACQEGSDDAQAAAAWGSLGSTLLALIFNPVFGRMADVRGRKCVMIGSISIACIPAVVLLSIELLPISPSWYYAAFSLIGILNFMSVAIASLSDNVSEEYRAPTYGMLIGVFYGALATGPTFSLFLGHRLSTIVSLGLTLMALLMAIFVLPETLPESIRLENIEAQQRLSQQNEADSSNSLFAPLWRLLQRPFQDISILNRSWTMRLVTAASFLENMVFTGDATLLLYYIEDRLDMGDGSIATLFVCVGLAGCFLQGGALQPLVKCMGEKYLLVGTFCAAALHNFLFGMASSKMTIYLACIIGQFAKLNFAVIASYASKGVSPNEQGLVQGALAATNAIGSGLGPLSMNFVYGHTKNRQHFGPGFMFVYAGLMDMMGIIIVALLPPPAGPSRSRRGTEAMHSANPVSMASETCIEEGGTNSLEEPLLDSQDDRIATRG